MLTSVLFMTVCFLAYANGANDNFKGVATLFGSGTADYRLALTWATLMTLTGSICALFLAQTLMVKFSGKDLAPEALIQSLPFMIAVAGGAGMTVILATRCGFPISTTHALLGAMLGSTLPATLGNMNPAPLLNNFVLPLLLSPFAALLLSVLLHRILGKLTFSRPLCLCVEQLDDNLALADSSHAAMALSDKPSSALVIAPQTVCAERDVKVVLGFSGQRILNGLHFCSAGAVCFARALNDTPKMAALLLLAPGFNLRWIIAVIAVAMLLGGLSNARQVAETMSCKITPITPAQGLSANVSTALLVIFASKLGMPVSTTHVSVGALFGIGLISGKANSNVIVMIALSWLLTLPCAALCSAVIYIASSYF